MKKEFNSKDEFIAVISGITKDGSVIMDMKGGVPNVPKEKQFDYVAKAKELSLEDGVANLPTALRFELIKEGYEFLLEGLRFEELDGPSDYWPGRMTSYILRNFPEYEPKVNWDKLKNNFLLMVLLDQPQFINKIDFTKLNERTLSDLIIKKPEYAEYIDFNKLNTPEGSQFWFSILKKQPQFADKCNWSLLNDNQRADLVKLHPDIKVNL